ncbi:MAG: pyridoxamine 5'-phosphate oxidase family protein [Pseudomonadota bacterium]
MRQLNEPSNQLALRQVLSLMDQAQDLTLATVRPDGFPQATTVSFAHDGLTIFVGAGIDSQKAHNIRQNNKVSLTINAAYPDWQHIKGLSMGALAEIVSTPAHIAQAAACIMKRFPQIKTMADAGLDLPWAGAIFLRISPCVISLLDYEQGFGHTELFAVH